MKTAVDWLYEKMFCPLFSEEEQLEWLEKAKEMEREQIENSYFDGCNYVDNGFGENPTDYYNEIFK